MNFNAKPPHQTGSAVQSLNAATGEAFGLPGWTYADAWSFERERNTIFRTSWFAVAYASDLPRPGDMLSVSIAGWELLLVRNKANEIRCFHNICRHRGMKLVDGLENGTTIRCKYHCWTYDMSGQLIGTPHIGGPNLHQAEGIERAELGLRQIRCDVWRDLIFVDIDGKAPSLIEHFRPLDEAFGEYELDTLHLAPETTPEREVSYNWKIHIEGGIESYHLPWVHPQLELPPAGYRFEEDGGGVYIGIKTPMSEAEMKRRAAVADTPDKPIPPSFRFIQDRLIHGEAPQFLITFILPNVTAVIMPNYLILGLLRPLAVDKTVVRRKFYYIGDAATNAEYAAIRADIANVWVDILEQDIPYLTEVQKLARLRDAIGFSTRFSPYWEVGLHKFQQYVARATGLTGDCERTKE